MGEDRAHWLARQVAQAADAWLTDPQDSEVYRRLVGATLAWRRYTQPMLEGTEDAGRRDRAPVSAATGPAPQPVDPATSAPPADPTEGLGATRLQTVGDIAKSADPRAALGQLIGRVGQNSGGGPTGSGPAAS